MFERAAQRKDDSAREESAFSTDYVTEPPCHQRRDWIYCT